MLGSFRRLTWTTTRNESAFPRRRGGIVSADYNAIIAAAAATIRQRRGRRCVSFAGYVLRLLPAEEFTGTRAEQRGQKWVLVPIALAMSGRRPLPTLPELATQCRTSVRTTRRNLRLLAASGWVTATPTTTEVRA
jgi:hypothetical protein